MTDYTYELQWREERRRAQLQEWVEEHNPW